MKFKGNIYETVVYKTQTWNIMKRDTQKIILLKVAVYRRFQNF